MAVVELRATSMAVGGSAVARVPDGRVVFVEGALPGEVVRAEVIDEHPRFSRAVVLEVVEPSVDRVRPPCEHREAGCGGCDWQHAAVDAQSRLRREIVTGELARTRGLADPLVEVGPALEPNGGRTTVRGTAGVDGRFAYRMRRSHETVAVDSCLVAHPLAEEIIAEGRFGDSSSITIRVGAATGERLVVLGGGGADSVSVPDGVLVVTEAELRAGRRAWIHEEVAGRRWRVSAGSFFQPGPAAAEVLVAVVAESVARHGGADGAMVDLFSGVGLFAGTVGNGRRVVAVERSASSVADARTNLPDEGVRVVRTAVERWRPTRADLVVADPARAGLGRLGVGAVAACGPRCVVVVHCEVGALRRDAELLLAAGFVHDRSVVIDLFAHTSRCEVVSTFVRD